MNGYLVFYNGKQTKVFASTSLAAQLKGIDFFRVPKSKQHTVSAHLVELPTGQVSQVLS